MGGGGGVRGERVNERERKKEEVRAKSKAEGRIM